MEILAIRDLKKNFGSKEVLCGLDLSVSEHSIFGFIGRNAAAKCICNKGQAPLNGNTLIPAGGTVTA